MKLYKNDILSILKEYNFNNDDFIILSGAALVLFGIKESTMDIDLAVSKKLYNSLLKRDNCILEKNIGKYNIWILDDIINFSDNGFDSFKYIISDGYKVQMLESIYELKKKLSRDKDKEDLEKIVSVLKNT